MEFPSEHDISARARFRAPQTYTNADMDMSLSEYTLDGPVPDSLKGIGAARVTAIWSSAVKIPQIEQELLRLRIYRQPGWRSHLSPGKKRCPIQFFKDGLSAPEHQKFGIRRGAKLVSASATTFSYTRVTDELVKQGAQLLIVPTMDVADWGKHQHQLHALVARSPRGGIWHSHFSRSGMSSGISQGR